MAVFDLAENPDGEGYTCSACHDPEGEHSLKIEAEHALDIGPHNDLPDDATYDDCLSCHAVSDEDTEFRNLMHTVHMESDNSHAPASCFGCHSLDGYAPDSPSGQFQDSAE